MTTLIPFIWIAGGLQLLVAASNYFAPRMLQCRENLDKVSPTFREVFQIQYLYIILILVAQSLLCFCFATDLAGASSLGRALSAYLAAFWGLRLLMQLFHYNAEIKRRFPLFHWLYIAAFVILTAIFVFAAIA
jgi:hypothetical protein